MDVGAPTSALAEALRELADVRRSPQGSIERLRLILRQADDDEVEAVARRALGLALRELGQLAQARVELERSLAAARRSGLAERRGEALSSLALVLAYSGDARGALRSTRAASRLLRGGAAARNRMQSGLILHKLGREDEALAEYRLALGGFGRAGDELGQVQVRLNRSVIAANRGDTAAGAADLRRAMALAEKLGQTLLVASCAHNLGFLLGRAGDVPAALASFAEAERTYELADPSGGWAPVLEIDRAELLLSAGLFEEAERRVGSALAVLDAGENVADASEARILAARVSLAAGDPAASAAHAEAAARAFAGQRRMSLRLLADTALVSARAAQPLQSEEERRALRRLAVRVARRLERTGRRSDGREVRIIAGQLALEDGDARAGRLLLEPATRWRRSDPFQVRLQSCHATALLRQADGDGRGARRAVRSGLRVLHAHRASFGSAELRAHAGARGTELAAVGIRLAMAEGDTWTILRTLDTLRASTAGSASVRPPPSTGLAHALAELRRIDAGLREAGDDAARQAALLRRRRRLEDGIRDEARATAGTAGGAVTERLTPAGLRALLDGRSLVSYFALDGLLHAVVVGRGRPRLVTLGPLEPIVRAIDAVVAALHRLAAGRGSPAARRVVRAALDADARGLDAAIIEPLGLGPAPLVIIPSGTLYALPWHALPGLRTTSVAVAPSVSGWLRARSAERPGGAAVLIAGPGLAAADAEIVALGGIYPRASSLTGSGATVEAALEALDGAPVAHLAAHGTFRADNPLFSSLRLADGPLTVYDIERLGTPPDVLVLSACDGGRHGVTGGDELVGLAATLIRMGSRSLLAPLVPISDRASLPLAVGLHRELATGASAADALARARAEGADDDESAAARASFVALGA